MGVKDILTQFALLAILCRIIPVMQDTKYRRLPEEKHYQKTYSISYEVMLYLRTRHNKSATVDQAVRGTKEFKAWLTEQKRLKKNGGVQTTIV